MVVSDASLQPSHHTAQTTGYSPSWQGNQGGPYLGQNTSPMHQAQAQFDPRMFATGGPLYDPRVHCKCMVQLLRISTF